MSDEPKLPITLVRNGNLPKYKVSKLDSLRNVYLIYAERNGKIYKIVSKKSDSMAYQNIKLNGEYGFLLQSLFPPMTTERGDTLWKRLDIVNAVEFNGTAIAIEKNCVNDIFRAENVMGLCITF